MQSNRSESRAEGLGTKLSLALLAILLTAVAAFFCFRFLQPKIERDLTARVTSALAGTGAPDFTIDGQSVILAGAVGSDADRKRAEESAQSVYGVSRVINKLTVEEDSASQPSDIETTASTASTVVIAMPTVWSEHARQVKFVLET